MNPKLKALLDKINKKKAEVLSLAETDMEKAEEAKKELVAMQKKFDLMAEVMGTGDDDGDDDGDPEDRGMKPADEPKQPEAKTVAKAFVNALRACLRGKHASEKDADILAQDRKFHDEMTEAEPDDDDSDGSVTVPNDISNKIQELRRATDDDLELLVNVEPVSTKQGSRVIEVDADATAWPEVAEGGEFQEQDTPQFKTIAYKIKKYGGILKVTAELLEDSAENILAYLNKWIAKKSRATRNAKILAALKTCVGDTTYAISGLDDLKDVFNITLDPSIAQGSVVVTNQTGFNYLDKLKDNDGKYILQPDPTKPTQKLLFGAYPVKKLSNKVLKNVARAADADKKITAATLVPVWCGDLKEAVTLFDRKVISVDVSRVAGDLWAKDKTGMKVRDRFDVQPVDKSAVVLGQIVIETAG